MAKWMYVCVSASCGHVELTNYAPSSTRRCPVCGGMMKREAAQAAGRGCA